MIFELYNPKIYFLAFMRRKYDENSTISKIKEKINKR